MTCYAVERSDLIRHGENKGLRYATIYKDGQPLFFTNPLTAQDFHDLLKLTQNDKLMDAYVERLNQEALA